MMSEEPVQILHVIAFTKPLWCLLPGKEKAQVDFIYKFSETEVQ